MKKLITNVAAIILATSLITSCRKNDTIENPTDLYDNLKVTNQSMRQLFTVNVGSGGNITGTGGSKITFPPNFAVNTNGTAYTGNAIVEVKESIWRKNWMMDGVSATAQNDILISGGMLNLEVTRTDNGAELLPAPAMQVPNTNLSAVIRAEMPRNPNLLNVSMNLFVPDSSAVGTNAPVLAWRTALNFPFNNGPNSYIFQLPKFKWVNCDKLYDQPGPKTTIRITPDITAFAGATDVQALLVYRNLSSVISLPLKPGFFESYINSIPVGSQADCVLIGKAADGKILFKVIAANTFTALQNITITPEIVAGATVQAYLESIN